VGKGFRLLPKPFTIKALRFWQFKLNLLPPGRQKHRAEQGARVLKCGTFKCSTRRAAGSFPGRVQGVGFRWLCRIVRVASAFADGSGMRTTAG